MWYWKHLKTFMFSCFFSRKPSKGALGTGCPTSHIGRQDRDLIVADCWRKTGKIDVQSLFQVSELDGALPQANTKGRYKYIALLWFQTIINNYYWLQKEPLLWKTTKNWHFGISSIWSRWANRINDQLHDIRWCVAKYDNTRIQHNTVKINKVSPFCFLRQSPKLWSVESNEMLSHLRHPHRKHRETEIFQLQNSNMFRPHVSIFKTTVSTPDILEQIQTFGHPKPRRRSNPPACARSALLRDHAIISKQHLRNLRFRAVNILETEIWVRYNQPKMCWYDLRSNTTWGVVLRDENIWKLYHAISDAKAEISWVRGFETFPNWRSASTWRGGVHGPFHPQRNRDWKLWERRTCQISIDLPSHTRVIKCPHWTSPNH